MSSNNTSNQSNQSAQGSRSNADPTNASIKESFGSYSNFVHSYGHQLTPDGFDAAKEVRDAFRQADQSQQNNK